MTTKAILLLCLLLPVAAAPAQEAPDASTFAHEEPSSEDTLYIPVVAYWTWGEQQTLDVIKGKRQYRDGVLLQADSSVTRYEVTVITETDTSYTIRWRPLSHRSSGPADRHAEALGQQALYELAEDGLLYRTDELGTFQELENLDLLMRHASAYFDHWITTLDDEMREIGQSIVNAFMRPETFEALAAQPIMLYHQLHGYEYLIGIPWQYEDVSPDAFGNTLVPWIGEAVIDEVDVEREVATLRSLAVADTAATTDLFANVVRMLGGEEGQEAPDSLRGIVFEMYQEDEYVIDYAWGWIRSMRWMMVVEAQGARMEKYYRMRLLDP